MIEVPSYAIHSDPAFYPEAATFDGFRSYKLRQGGSAIDNARNQFVTTNEQNFAFGYGRHACPGRFFATNEIKMILTRLILDYDIKMPGGREERWEQMDIGRSSMPHPGKTVMLKRAEV
jgi:cytochrome P450